MDSVRSYRDADLVLISVADRGVGFDMQYHDRIFGIFERLHRQEDYPGTGVGLAIVRKVAERHGGRAWAESAPGQGSTFFLAFPTRASLDLPAAGCRAPGRRLSCRCSFHARPRDPVV